MAEYTRQKYKTPKVRRKRVTEDACDISHLSREVIHGWYESTDRRAGSKLTYIPLSRLLMHFSEASRPDDMGTHE